MPDHPNATPRPAGDPPLEAERAVLACMLMDAEALARGLKLLRPEAFYRVAHARIFRALETLHARGSPPSLVLLRDQLEGDGTLEAVGGSPALAALLDAAGSAANLVHHARLVGRHNTRRRARAAAQELAERLDDPTHDLDTLLGAAAEAMEAARRAAAPGTMAPPLAEQVLSGAELLARQLPPLHSIAGAGLLTAGGLSLLVGMPGLGKTYLALQLLDAIAAGGAWLNHPTPGGRAGLLELEMPLQSVQARLVARRLSPERGARLDFLVMPEGVGYAYEGRTVDELSRWAERGQLRLLVMDPLRDLHDGDENVAFDVGRLYGACKTIRARTGVAIMLLHHVNKLDFDRSMSLRTCVLRSVRGSGRLIDEPETVLGLVERVGHTLLVYAKTRHAGGLPEAIAVRQGADGYFEPCDTPAELANRNVEKVRKALEFFGDRGGNVNEIAKMSELDRGTVKRHLETIGAICVRKGRELIAYQNSDAKAAEELPF